MAPQVQVNESTPLNKIKSFTYQDETNASKSSLQEIPGIFPLKGIFKNSVLKVSTRFIPFNKYNLVDLLHNLD